MSGQNDDMSHAQAELAALRARVAELERELAEARRDSVLFDVLLEVIPDTIYFKDGDSRFLRVNKSELALLGLTDAQEIIGKTDADLHDASFARQTRDDESKLLATGQPIINQVERIQLSDGSIRCYSTTKVPFGSAAPGIIGIGRDITAQVLAEEKLRQSRERYQLLFGAMMDGFIVHEIVRAPDSGVLAYRAIEVNPAFETITGLKSADIHGRLFKASKDGGAFWIRSQVEFIRDQAAIHFDFHDTTQDRYFEIVGLYPAEGVYAALIRERTRQVQTQRAIVESHDFIRRVADVSPVLIYIYSLAERRLTYANQHALRVIGLTPEKMLSLSFETLYERVIPSGARLDEENRNRYFALEDGEVHSAEYRVVHPEFGELCLQAQEIVFRRDSSGRVVEVLGTAIDMTEKVNAEHRLRESEQVMRTITDNIRDLVVLCDQNLNSTFLSPSYEKVLGYKIAEIIGTDLFCLVHPDDKSLVMEAVGHAVLAGTHGEMMFRSIHKDGHLVWFDASGQPLYDASGTFTGGIIVSRDITERKNAEAALRESQDRYRNLVENTHGIIACIDLDGYFLMINPWGAESLGYTPEEMIGRLVAEFLPDGASELVERYFERIDEKKAAQGICKLMTKNGGFRYWEYQDYCCQDGNGNTYIMAHALDVTERHVAQEALINSEERYRLIFEGTRDAISFVGKDGHRIVVNDRFAEMLGYTPEELLSFPALESIHPDDRNLVEDSFYRRIAGEDVSRVYEYRLLHKNGATIHVEGAFDVVRQGGEIIGVCAILRDISDRLRADMERRNLERQLLHVQKLESLGLLAGGIAHDFNNILVAILGNADLALTDVPVNSNVSSRLEEIRRAGVRASELCRQMLAYSGKGKFVIESFAINELVQEMARLLKVTIPKSATLVVELAEGLLFVEGDATQIRQVVMNLISNASEALDATGGVIAVRTGECILTEDDLAGLVPHDSARSGRHNYIEVSDTGCGMTSEVLSKVFDPFFTTKFTGRGLGMAAVLGIVRGHHGGILVDTAPGFGTVFKVYLPVSLSPVAPVREQRRERPLAWTGQGTVLLIDDEESVRDVTTLALTRLGFEVLTAVDGELGVEMFRKYSETVDVVLLDLTMPRMDGHEAIRHIRAIRADVPVIFISGFSEQDAIDSVEVGGVLGFLQKPFQLHQLAEAIRQVLPE